MKLERERLAEEQDALRRVATLVAGGAPPEEVFRAVAAEVSVLFGSDVAAIIRFEEDLLVTVLGDVGGPHKAGARVTLDPGYVVDTVRTTGRSGRFDTDDPPAAESGSLVRALGVHSAVASPISVQGQLWGAVTVASRRGPLSSNAERQLTEFTELVATAVANAEAREQATMLAEEQAALRRVAELVAQAAPPSELFEAVTREVGVLLGGDQAGMARFEGDSVVTVGAWAADGDHPPVPPRWPMMEGDPATIILEARGPVRRDDWAGIPGPIAEFIRGQGIRCTVGAPIIVQGRIWGALALHSRQSDPLPLGTELRMAHFTDLVATAVANAEAREQVMTLAEEQAALRRVAELVARECSSGEIFQAVTDEAWQVLDTEAVGLLRFEPDGTATLVAQSQTPWEPPPLGTRFTLDGDNTITRVVRTEQAARADDWTGATGAVAAMADSLGVRSIVATPIVVEGRLWGTVIAATSQTEPLPANTENRLAQFTELVGTAIANADSRDQLTTSRARLLTEADDARRRVVRDLHDGAQQRLVHTVVALKLAQTSVEQADGGAQELIDQALQHAERGIVELRELAHGILPAVLTHRGLRAGVGALVERVSLPVTVALPDVRLAAEIEASAYFIVAEALTNVMKHSRASRAEVVASLEDGVLGVEIRDDGVGGADSGGRGVVGMADRVTALGGQLTIESPAGAGTCVRASFPVSPTPELRAAWHDSKGADLRALD